MQYVDLNAFALIAGVFYSGILLLNLQKESYIPGLPPAGIAVTAIISRQWRHLSQTRLSKGLMREIV